MSLWSITVSAATTLATLVFALAIVATLWYIMWKFAFEPNPIVREFFDLDKKSNDENNSKKKSKKNSSKDK